MKYYEISAFVNQWIFDSKGEDYEIRTSQDQTELTITIRSKLPKKTGLDIGEDGRIPQH
jgi:hypothetical protein